MQILKTLFFVVIAICFLFVSITSAEEALEGKIETEKDIKAHSIIYLSPHGGNIIDPAEVTIKPGTTVVWINRSKALVEIHFEGKQVTKACKRPVHFVVDEKGSFISNKIPNGAVANLCVIEKGEFNYVVRTSPFSTSQAVRHSKEYKGKIIVE